MQTRAEAAERDRDEAHRLREAAQSGRDFYRRHCEDMQIRAEAAERERDHAIESMRSSQAHESESLRKLHVAERDREELKTLARKVIDLSSHKGGDSFYRLPIALSSELEDVLDRQQREAGEADWHAQLGRDLAHLARAKELLADRDAEIASLRALAEWRADRLAESESDCAAKNAQIASLRATPPTDESALREAAARAMAAIDAWRNGDRHGLYVPELFAAAEAVRMALAVEPEPATDNSRAVARHLAAAADAVQERALAVDGRVLMQDSEDDGCAPDLATIEWLKNTARELHVAERDLRARSLALRESAKEE
jgi:hypothetical protein